MGDKGLAVWLKWKQKVAVERPWPRRDVTFSALEGTPVPGTRRKPKMCVGKDRERVQCGKHRVTSGVPGVFTFVPIRQARGCMHNRFSCSRPPLLANRRAYWRHGCPTDGSRNRFLLIEIKRANRFIVYRSTEVGK